MINLQQINRAAETQTEKVARDYRRAYYLASNECKKCRVSESRFEKALNCIKKYNTLQGYRDISLRYDSFCTESGARLSAQYDKKCDNLSIKLNKMLKPFGFVVTWGTFAHVSPIGNKCHQIF